MWGSVGGCEGIGTVWGIWGWGAIRRDVGL